MRWVPTKHIPKETLLHFEMKAKDQNSYIFCNKFGNLYNPRVPFGRTLTKAKTRNCRFHDLMYAHLSDTHHGNAVQVLDKKMDVFWTLGPKSGGASEIREVVSDYVLMR